ncbi:hypothetical protein DFJ73DRAFT_760537 [Zopfochytrium polystomum]|nr:hypothetical protein DFJ73DRAFT_760537 [Zopfochytrium polystomum]
MASSIKNFNGNVRVTLFGSCVNSVGSQVTRRRRLGGVVGGDPTKLDSTRNLGEERERGTGEDLRQRDRDRERGVRCFTFGTHHTTRDSEDLGRPPPAAPGSLLVSSDEWAGSQDIPTTVPDPEQRRLRPDVSCASSKASLTLNVNETTWIVHSRSRLAARAHGAAPTTERRMIVEILQNARKWAESLFDLVEIADVLASGCIVAKTADLKGKKISRRIVDREQNPRASRRLLEGTAGQPQTPYRTASCLGLSFRGEVIK